MTPDFVKDLSPEQLSDLMAFLSRQSLRGPDLQKNATAPKEGAR
jgi:hypothetical protein